MYILKMTRHGNKFEQVFEDYERLKETLNALIDNGFQLQEYSKQRDVINE